MTDDRETVGTERQRTEGQRNRGDVSLRICSDVKAAAQ